MTTGYEKPVLDPVISDWSAVPRTLESSQLQSLRHSARRRLILAAETYRQRLMDVAVRSALLALPETSLAGDPDSLAIVMTGHQPVIFHSGLTFKYETTERFAADHNAVGVAIVIDTDEGDAGAYPFPDGRNDTVDGIPGTSTSLRITPVTFSAQPSLYCSAKKASVESIRKTAIEVQNGLLASGCLTAATRFARFAEQYASVDTDSMMEANLIVRWSAGIGGRLLEVPLSDVCRFPEVIQLFSEILAKPFEFAQCYNDTLKAFRGEQKIRNEANPFPDLLLDDTTCELPFWIVDATAGTRQIVSIHRQGYERTIETPDRLRMEVTSGHETSAVFSLLVGGRQLVPRGALITAMLRILFSDLFVHGTGGGRYDRYTDSLIRTWWKVEPTPFAVASASRYLFDEQRSRIAELQKISETLRDLQFNPQRYFGAGLFSPATEEHLKQRLTAKDEAVAQLQQARARGESAQDAGRVIQQVGDEIKLAVSAEFEPRMAELRSIPAESIAAWNSRTWPWFYFSSSRDAK